MLALTNCFVNTGFENIFSFIYIIPIA